LFVDSGKSIEVMRWIQEAKALRYVDLDGGIENRRVKGQDCGNPEWMLSEDDEFFLFYC
jgi:hypothetical protein